MDRPRLTKDVREVLLLLNEGFKSRTSYSAKNFSETNDYEITDGHLEVRSRGKTSWADSNFDETRVVDEAATHRFLRDHLDELDTAGLKEGLEALAAEKAKNPPLPPAKPAVPDSPAITDSGPTADPKRPFAADRVVALVGAGIAATVTIVTVAPQAQRWWKSQVRPWVQDVRRRMTATPSDEPTEARGQAGDGPGDSTDQTSGPPPSPNGTIEAHDEFPEPPTD